MRQWTEELQVELARCTKEELITLVRENCWSLRAQDVRRVRGEALLRRAKELEAAGLAMMDKNLGFERVRQYFEGDALWQKGEALRKKANELIFGKPIMPKGRP